MIHFHHTNPDAESLWTVRPLGPQRPTTYTWVGTVFKLRPGMGLPTQGEVSGRLAMALITEQGESVVAHFDPARRPKVGTHVGVKGSWLIFDLEPEEDFIPAKAWTSLEGTPVDFQIEVDTWSVVGALSLLD